MWCREFPLHGGIARGGCAVMSPGLCHGFVWSPGRRGRVWHGEELGWHSAGPGCQSMLWDGELHVGTAPWLVLVFPGRQQAYRAVSPCLSVLPWPAELLQGEHELLAQHTQPPRSRSTPCEDPRSAHSHPRSLMPEGDRRGADPCAGKGAGWGRWLLPDHAWLHLGFSGEVCALCCSSSVVEGSLAALPAFLTTQQSKHGVNSALQRLVTVSGCAPGITFHPSHRSSCTAERGSAVSRIQSVQITGKQTSSKRVGNTKIGKNPN